MKWWIFIVFSFTLGLTGQAQLLVQSTTLDFGEVNRETLRWKDVELTNEGNKKQYVLRVEAPRSIQHQLSAKVINPGEKAYLRVYINPFQRGKYSETIRVWTSDANEPQSIKIKADIKETNTLALQSCPSFNDIDPYTLTFGLTIKVVNQSGDPIENVQLLVGKSQQETYQGTTNNKGEVSLKNAAIGLYKVQASRDKNIVFNQMHYFNRNENFLLITLRNTRNASPSLDETYAENSAIEKEINNKQETKTETTAGKKVNTVEPEDELPIEKSEDLIDEAIARELERLDTIAKSNDLLDDAIERELAQQAAKEIKVDSTKGNKTALSEEKEETPEDPKGFSRKEFAPNNIVFLMDVSTSMRYLERIDLLKFSVIELTQILRDIDYVSVVTYSTEAKTRLAPTNGKQRNKIDSLIWELEARGITASDKGLDQAYELAEQAYIEQGNNQVILITDGAFKAQPLYRMIKKQAEKGITLSVVGMKTDQKTAKELKEMSRKGQGTFVNVEDLTQAKGVLVAEIKKNSKKP